MGSDMAEPAAKSYALLDANGVIVNVIVWDGTSIWPVPDGHSLSEVQPGVLYRIGLKPGEDYPPAEPTEPPPTEGTS